MKLLVVFVDDDDAPGVTLALRERKMAFTMLNSTSGFLGDDSRTFLIGLDEEHVEACLDVFREHCTNRWADASQYLPKKRLENLEQQSDRENGGPVKVNVGGAVAFIVEADKVL